ncbi:MAG: ATP-binding protein [Chloroflexi bacterium]|nr:ATP-binding protein [Chloroflexota bacterium]
MAEGKVAPPLGEYKDSPGGPKGSAADEGISEIWRRLDDLTRLVSDWVWETDPHLRLTYVSERVFNVLGFHPQQLVGRYISELWTFALATGFTFDTPSPQPFRELPFEIEDQEGKRHSCLASGLPVFDRETGAFRGFRGTVEDITERKKADESLREAVEIAELANRAKTEFLANTSHELRTPLNAIIGFSEMIKHEMFGPLANVKYAEYIGDIHRSGRLLLELVNDILDVAAIESSQLELNEDVLAIGKVADASLCMVRSRAEMGCVTLAISVDEHLPLLIADERRIQQALLNLLSNAVKFTPKGGTVSLHAHMEDDGSMALVVSDTGIGMDEDGIAKALTKFGQVDSGLDRQYEGTGLGLPLVQGLMAAHGGTFELRSEKGVGTNAEIRFPKERVRN